MSKQTKKLFKQLFFGANPLRNGHYIIWRKSDLSRSLYQHLCSTKDSLVVSDWYMELAVLQRQYRYGSYDQFRLLQIGPLDISSVCVCVASHNRALSTALRQCLKQPDRPASFREA